MRNISIVTATFFLTSVTISCNEDNKKENESEIYSVPAQTQHDSDRTSVRVSKEGVNVESKSGNKNTEFGISSDSVNFQSEKKK